MSNQVVVKASLLPANFILFSLIVAKLMGWITWSWGWVLFPLWLPPVVFLVFVLFMASIFVGSWALVVAASILKALLK